MSASFRKSVTVFFVSVLLVCLWSVGLYQLPVRQNIAHAAGQTLSIQSVYTTDANQQSKSTFLPGDAIYYHIDANNAGQSAISVVVSYEALTGTSKHTYIFNQGFSLSMPVGASRFYTPATVPNDALSGAYTINAEIKQNGLGGAVAQSSGTFTVGTSSQSIVPTPDLSNSQPPPSAQLNNVPIGGSNSDIFQQVKSGLQNYGGQLAFNCTIALVGNSYKAVKLLARGEKLSELDFYVATSNSDNDQQVAAVLVALVELLPGAGCSEAIVNVASNGGIELLKSCLKDRGCLTQVENDQRLRADLCSAVQEQLSGGILQELEPGYCKVIGL